ncbi:MAG: acyltransferase [Microthrixaceae bacterium]
MTATSTTGPIRIEAPALGYEPALDGVRALAVLVIMGYHFGAEQWLEGGIVGVDWFFVLSGFLITNLLLDERNRDDAISLRGFYHRRILRLFPAMYVFLGCVLLASPLLYREGVTDIFAEIGSAAVYSYQLFIGFFGFGSEDSPRALLHLWTLSVEEWFYFFWPVALVWGISRVRNQRRLLVLAGVFVAFWMSVRLSASFWDVDFGRDFADSDPYPYWAKVLWRFSVMRFDVLVLGCMLAIIRRRIVPLDAASRRWVNVLGIAGGILALVFLLGSGRLPGFEVFDSIGYNASLFGVAAFVLWLHCFPSSTVSRLMSVPALVWVGKRSYGLYLWHEVPNVIGPIGTGKVGFAIRAVLLYALSFGIAELSWRFVESPFLRRKHRRYRNISGR